MNESTHDPVHRLLARHRPKIARLLEAEPHAEFIQITTEDGHLVCRAAGNRIIDGPATEERLGVRASNIAKSGDPIIVCPAGFGGLFRKLREQASSEVRWFLIEPLADLFRASLVSEPWWDEVLRDERVKLFLGRGAVQAFFDWAQRHAILFSGKPALIVGRDTIPEESQALKRFTEKTRELVTASRNVYQVARNELNRHYRTPRKRNRVLLLEPDHTYLAQSIVSGIREAGYEGVLSGGGRRLAEVMGRNKEFIYVNDHRPDLILVLHHNPLPPGAGELLQEYDIPLIIWYLDHPRVVNRIIGDPRLYRRAYTFDKNYERVLRELGHSLAGTIPIGAFLPLCVDSEEEKVEIEHPVTFLGGAVGGQYLTFQRQHPKLIQALDGFIESAVVQAPLDEWALDHNLLPRSDETDGVSRTEILTYVLQGVSYKRRLRYLSAAMSYDLALFGRQWDDYSLCGRLTKHAAGGHVQYGNDLARLYRTSAININILDAMMVDSINLRSFDVMASGGFLLSEYRPAYERIFRIGEELDCFRTPEELSEKIGYYLDHAELRREIAERGRRRVLEEHTVSHRMEQLLSAELPATGVEDVIRE